MPDIALYDAAFYAIIRQKWESSMLQELLVDATHEIHISTITESGSYSNCALLKRNKFISSIMTICNGILKSDFLPYIIKNNLASAFYEIAFEIESFLGSLLSDFKEISKEKITYFLQRVIISQYGDIDKKNSVLKIISDSKFGYKFLNTILIRNCIEKPDLEKLSQEVLENEKSQPNWKKTIVPIKTDVDESLKLMYLPTVDKFVNAQMVVQYRTENFTKVVLYGENVNVIKLVYKNEKPAEKQDFLLRLSYYAFKKEMLFSASFAVFLYENMSEQAWQDILRQYFNEVFWILLGSRRYRRYMLTWFRQAIPTMSRDTYIEMISSEAWKSPTLVLHESYAMENLYKTIWDETPEKFKYEHPIRQAVIKSTVHVIQNVEILEYVLRDYNKSVRAQMLKQSVLHYLITQREYDYSPVFDYMEKMKRVCANLDLPENVLVGADVEELRYYVLAMDGSKAGLLGHERLTTAETFIPDLSSFKINLQTDNGFIEMFLIKHWRTRNILPILMWCADFDYNACSEYLLSLDEKIFERVYEKALYKEGSIGIADQGFAALKIDLQLVRRIKVNVLSKPEVRKHLLTTYFRNSFFEFVDQWQLFHFRTTVGKRGFFRNIFESDYGKEALWELILHIEGSLTIMQQIDHVNVFTNFCDKIAFKYVLGQEIREVLMDAGHPNIWNAPITYQGRAPTQQELPELRKVVDFRYRSLLALLHRSSAVMLLNHKLETVTKVSVVLAQAVNLDIPEVY